MKTRKNKNYTTIFIENMTPEAFTEVVEYGRQLTKENARHVVYKPTKQALAGLEQKYPMPIGACEQGNTYYVLGVPFTFEEVDDQGVTWFTSHIPNKKRFGIFYNQKSNYALALIEEVFQAITGTVMYF